MKKSLIKVMIMVSCIDLQASNDQLKKIKQRFGMTFFKNTSRQAQKITFDAHSDGLSKLEDARIKAEEISFLKTKEVQDALLASCTGWNADEEIKIIETAFKISPSLYATSTLKNKLDRYYHTKSPEPRKLLREMKVLKRAELQDKTNHRKQAELQKKLTVFGMKPTFYDKVIDDKYFNSQYYNNRTFC
jgi:hypothetical protein